MSAGWSAGKARLRPNHHRAALGATRIQTPLSGLVWDAVAAFRPKAFAPGAGARLCPPSPAPAALPATRWATRTWWVLWFHRCAS